MVLHTFLLYIILLFKKMRQNPLCKRMYMPLTVGSGVPTGKPSKACLEAYLTQRSKGLPSL
jgi:hypothetical protein